MGSVFNHVGHCVSDLERTRRFYVEVLGFEPWYEFAAPDASTAPILELPEPIGLTAVYLRRDGFVLELLSFADAGTNAGPTRKMNDIGLTHLSVSVDDIDATAALAVEYGGAVLPQTNICLAVMIRDPEGQLIELLPMTFRSHLPA